MSGRLDRISGAGLTVRGLEWVLAGDGIVQRVELSIERVETAGWAVDALNLQCVGPGLSAEVLACAETRVTATAFGRPIAAEGALTWERGADRWRFRGTIRSESDLALSGAVSMTPDGIEIEAESLNLAVQLLASMSGQAVEVYSGSLDLSGEVTVTPKLRASLTGTLEALAFDTPDGSQAGDGVAARLSLELAEDDAAWRFALDGEAFSGEVLLGDLYLSLSDTPDLALMAEGELTEDGSLRLDRMSMLDPGIAEVQGAALVAADGTLSRLRLDAIELTFPQAYDRYLGSLVSARGGGAVELSGGIQGAIDFEDGQFHQVELAIGALDAVDEKGRYAVGGLDGQVRFETGESTLAWQSASIYAVPLGQAAFHLMWRHGRLELVRPTRVPVLDGALSLVRFGLGYTLDYGLDDLEIEGEVEPLSLEPLTQALGWPEFGGALAGRIPRVSLQQQELVVDGDLVMDVFGGQVQLGGLRLERLFGVLPTLAVDVQMDDIDLAQLTQTFSFGRIEGRLDGSMAGLRLLNWEPVAFDLVLNTDPDSPGKRRISQRAVDNLSSIGGGPTAAVSQTFLRIFDDFGYKRLGLSCRLHDNVCVMDGVGGAPNGGYYIVEGSGLPRIDVIGYSRQVDWPQLLRRLEAATRSTPAVD